MMRLTPATRRQLGPALYAKVAAFREHRERLLEALGDEAHVATWSLLFRLFTDDELIRAERAGQYDVWPYATVPDSEMRERYTAGFDA